MVRYIGAHPALKKSILDTIYYIQSINGNALQIFHGSPQSASKKSVKTITDSEADKIKKYIEDHDIYLVIHAPYTLNYVKPITQGTKKYLNRLIDELKLAERIGAVGSVLHYGSLTTYEKKKGLKLFAKSIEYVLERAPNNVYLILETSAGQGTSIGTTIDEMAEITSMISHKYQKQIRYCIDTAHIFTAGYSVDTVDGMQNYFKEFNKKIGLAKVELIQLNDSKVPMGSKVDRHESLMEGHLFKKQTVLIELLRLANKYNLPIILETHGDYAKEIELLHNLIFKHVNKRTSSLPKRRSVQSMYNKEPGCKRIGGMSINTGGVQSGMSNISSEKVRDKSSKTNIHQKVIDILRQFAQIYRSQGNTYRQRAYTKAVQSIRKMDKPIQSEKDLKRVKSLDGIGEGIYGKIEEIVLTGKSQKLNDILKNKTVSSESLLMTVDGIGPKFAKELVNKGITNLKQLQSAHKKKQVILTHRQQLGLQYYDDLQSKIPRKEMTKYKAHLEAIAQSCLTRGRVIMAGSYRYGVKESGDIDIILTSNDLVKRNDVKKSNLLKEYVDCLQKSGILIDTLEQGKLKYSGLVKLDKLVRHIDIRLSAKESLPTFLMYFAMGTDYSMAMRQKAKAKGYRLSEWGLYNMKAKKWVPVKTEHDVKNKIL